jgi:hypothetical protein
LPWLRAGHPGTSTSVNREAAWVQSLTDRNCALDVLLLYLVQSFPCTEFTC